MSSNDKSKASFDAASISTSSIASEKERAQADAKKKPSLLKRAVTGTNTTSSPIQKVSFHLRRHVLLIV